MRNLSLIVLISLIFLTTACSSLGLGPEPTATPTATATALPPSPTPSPTATELPTLTPTPSPSPTPEPTATPTLIPFEPFSDIFRFYRYWFDGDKTIVYFLNAERTSPVYGVINGMDFVCNPDPKYPRQMICEAPTRFEPGDGLTIEFFADEAHRQSVWQNAFKFPTAADESVYCETEYRMYASGCSYHSSCYNLDGSYAYSLDYYPGDPNDPWVPAGSCP